MTPEQHHISSANGEYLRKVWFMPPVSAAPHRLAVFLDGEYYLTKLDAVGVVQQLMGSRDIPPLSCVFVSHVGAAERHTDMTCNPAYARFVAEDVVAWAMSRHSAILPSGSLVAGVSLSGLMAVYVATQYPSVFTDTLCQSGSLWWFADNPIELPRTDAKVWLSVGDGETATNVTHPPSGLRQRVSQIDGVSETARRLQSLGATVHHRVFAGGHAFEPWREELADALKWLFSPVV